VQIYSNTGIFRSIFADYCAINKLYTLIPHRLYENPTLRRRVLGPTHGLQRACEISPLQHQHRTPPSQKGNPASLGIVVVLLLSAKASGLSNDDSHAVPQQMRFWNVPVFAPFGLHVFGSLTYRCWRVMVMCTLWKWRRGVRGVCRLGCRLGRRLGSGRPGSGREHNVTSNLSSPEVGGEGGCRAFVWAVSKRERRGLSRNWISEGVYILCTRRNGGTHLKIRHIKHVSAGQRLTQTLLTERGRLCWVHLSLTGICTER